MEQKTEASQAVTIEFALRQIIEADDNHALTQQLIDIGRAALKAQPAPAIAAKPAKYEQRFVSPQGMAAVWHDAQAETFHRHRNNGDLGDGWKHEVRALYAGPPAPTDPYQLDDDDDARFPNDTNVVILHIDRYWTLRGCEDICAALDAKPAPTEAAQGGFLVRVTPMNPEYADVHPELALEDALRVNPYGWPDGFQFEVVSAQSNTSNNSSSSQPSGNTGELAQGEDSARLDWLIENVSSGSIGFINGDFIGSQDFDDLKVYIDRARASAETGGVSRADLAKLLSDANPGDAT